jgi:hypothetical protein
MPKSLGFSREIEIGYVNRNGDFRFVIRATNSMLTKQGTHS